MSAGEGRNGEGARVALAWLVEARSPERPAPYTVLELELEYNNGAWTRVAFMSAEKCEACFLLD